MDSNSQRAKTSSGLVPDDASTCGLLSDKEDKKSVNYSNPRDNRPGHSKSKLGMTRPQHECTAAIKLSDRFFAPLPVAPWNKFLRKIHFSRTPKK